MCIEHDYGLLLLCRPVIKLFTSNEELGISKQEVSCLLFNMLFLLIYYFLFISEQILNYVFFFLQVLNLGS